MLHCYYAHGEDNEFFQRRSYWLLEEYVTIGISVSMLSFLMCHTIFSWNLSHKAAEPCREFMHIVFVHYLEVKVCRFGIYKCSMMPSSTQVLLPICFLIFLVVSLFSIILGIFPLFFIIITMLVWNK